MHMDVDTGSEYCEKMRMVMAAPISMDEPRLGEWYVSLLPMTAVCQCLSWMDRRRGRKLTLHDVVPIGDEANADHRGRDTKLPQGDLGLGGAGLASRPRSVHTSPHTDGVADVIGTVRERGSAGGDDLDVRVQMLDLVGVLGGVAVDALHAAALGRVVDADLRGVDVEAGAVEEGDDDLGGDALDESDQVVHLVDRAGAELVDVEPAHGPAEGAARLAEVGVVALLGVLEKLLVLLLRVLELVVAALLAVGVGLGRGVGLDLGDGVLLDGGRRVRVLTVRVLNDGVVGDLGDAVLGIGGSGALEEERAVEDHPPLKGVVLLDHAGVHEGDEEEGREEEQTEADAEGDGNNVPRGLGGEAETGRALVHDGERADGAGDQEEGGRGPDGPRERVLAHVHRHLDEHEDDGAEAARDEGSSTEAGEDGTETLAVVPAPLDLAGADGGDTHTGDGRDERVGGRDVGRVARAPHDPGSGTGRGAGEGEELDTGIVAEGVAGNDTVLDGRGRPGAHGEGARQLEYDAEHHGLAVRHGARRHAGGPGVGDIVWRRRARRVSQPLITKSRSHTSSFEARVGLFLSMLCRAMPGQLPTWHLWPSCHCRRAKMLGSAKEGVGETY